MVQAIILGICCFASITDIYVITVNRKKSYMSKFWTVLSIITGGILCCGWSIIAIYIKPENVWTYYMFSGVYAILVFVRVISLIDILKTPKEESKYVYKMGMLIKKDEEVFDDDRPLYCASSLILSDKSEEQNQKNNN